MAKFTAEQLLNHLYNKRLPQVYREADVDTKYCLKRYLQAMIEGGFAEAITSADGITDLTDPLKCPDSIFPLLFSSFGYTYSVDIPILYQRKILQNHGELYQKRGTIEYVYVLTRILTGFDCEVTTERVDGVRVLTIKMFVDNSVTAVDQQHYVNLVKRFVTEGYIPFYLDVETNIVVDVVDVPTAQQYIASAVEVEGITDISPIVATTRKGLATSLSPSLEKEPFTKFNILGYSRIVPRYINGNLINPNTVTYGSKVDIMQSATGTTTSVVVDLYTSYLYVPYGNKIYLNLVSPNYLPPTVYITVYSLQKVAMGSKTVSASNFILGKAEVDLSDILVNPLCGTDYYVRIAIIDNQDVTKPELPTLISAWIEDTGYALYSAGTRFKFDNEYYKNGESFPTYMVDIFDSNGAMYTPYCTEKGITQSFDPTTGFLTMSSTAALNYIAYTDCITAMKDESKYYISFSLYKSSYNTMASPILTALCSNDKGTLKEVILTKEVEGYVEEDNIYRYGYSFTVPKDFVVVRIKYVLCNSTSYTDRAVLMQVMSFECDPNTGVPYIDTEFQPYTLADGYNIYNNNLSVGIDGIKLLSYNDSNGKVIVRDSFDVLTATVTRRVGVNYDSLGNPTSVYKLSTPRTEVITEDYNGEVKAIPLTTFKGKTYVSMSQSMPYTRYEEKGGTEYHSCFELTTRVIE